MKISDGFILKEVAGNYIVISCGEDSMDFNSIITVNEIGAIIWRGIEAEKSKAEIIADILSEYAIDEATASADFDEFTTQLRNVNIITD